MGLTSSILEDQQLSEFRKLNVDENSMLDIPTPPENRRLTDKKGFIIFGILMLILIPFMIYTLVKSDIRRTGYYDSCGNFCGIKNEKIEGVACSGKDYTNMPYERFDIRTGYRICSDRCTPGDAQKGEHCDENGAVVKRSITDPELWNNAFNSYWVFIVIVIITTVLCLLTLVVFRYIPGVIVWGVSILSVFVTIGLTAYFWYAHSNADAENVRGAFLGLALLSTLFSIIIVLLFIFLCRKIKLIVLLYQETAKALFALPLMMLVPIITMILQLLVVALWVVTTVYMGTAAELTKVDEKNNSYYFKANGAMKFTWIYNILVAIWALQFLSGCQYMVLAGSVAQWFFKKNQTNSPILISFTNTMRYHLGTVCLGSFIIALIAFIKMLIKSLVSNSKVRWLVDSCCGNVLALLKFLSKNAYIETAIYGQSFFRSGKRAAKQLITNAESVVAVNFVGDYVLAMTQFLLLAASTGIAYAFFAKNPDFWLPTIVSLFINCIIITIFFGVFETIVDTLFICYCEDTSLNDGSANSPYYMSVGFKQFVDETEQVYKKHH